MKSRDNSPTYQLYRIHKRNMSDISYEEYCYMLDNQCTSVKYFKSINKADLSGIVRTGVIPYTYVDGDIMLCMGVDSESGDYTDFGGGLSKKVDSSIQGGAARELEEESLSTFRTNERSLSNCLCVYNSNIIIFLLWVPSYIAMGTVEKFNRELENETNPEVNAIKWINHSTLASMLDDGLVYQRIAKMLKESMDDIFQELKNKNKFSHWTGSCTVLNRSVVHAHN
jgi:hypothetical protein